MTPSATAAFGNLWSFANAVVRVGLPMYFYTAWAAACRLVSANKVDPDDLPPGVIPDCRSVNIGGVERRLFTRSYWDEGLQLTYNSILGPVQNGVGVKGGISITAFSI